MPLRINFAESEGFDISPIPSGIYSVTVLDAQVVEDTPSGYPYIRLTLVVDEGEYRDRRLWYRMSTHPRALEFTRSSLLALGIPREELAGGAVIELDEQDLIGLGCYAEVTQESYQGEMRNQVVGLRDRPSNRADRGRKIL